VSLTQSSAHHGQGWIATHGRLGLPKPISDHFTVTVYELDQLEAGGDLAQFGKPCIACSPGREGNCEVKLDHLPAHLRR
jgi:hypothetical protein